MKLKLIAILFLIKINAFVAQNNYKVDGNSLPNNAVLGSTNNQGFKIITDNQTTIDIDNSGKVKFKKSVKFDDKFVADSICARKIWLCTNDFYYQRRKNNENCRYY